MRVYHRHSIDMKFSDRTYLQQSTDNTFRLEIETNQTSRWFFAPFIKFIKLNLLNFCLCRIDVNTASNVVVLLVSGLSPDRVNPFPDTKHADFRSDISGILLGVRRYQIQIPSPQSGWRWHGRYCRRQLRHRKELARSNKIVETTAIYTVKKSQQITLILIFMPFLQKCCRTTDLRFNWPKDQSTEHLT